jgi:hypothetical protein
MSIPNFLPTDNYSKLRKTSIFSASSIFFFYEISPVMSQWLFSHIKIINNIGGKDK